MSIGTKSLLFGYHQFLLHPIGVAIAWWKLYGFPWDPRLWVAFFVHDLGYWGKPNMDGAEGEKHPFLGANIMHALFDSWKHARPFRWYEFTLYHSRFLARNHDVAFSQLCVADKYLIVLMPTWLQVLLTRVTGEIGEYRRGQNGRTPAGEMSDRQWVEAMKERIREWMRTEVRGQRTGVRGQKSEGSDPPHPTLSPRGEGEQKKEAA